VLKSLWSGSTAPPYDPAAPTVLGARLLDNCAPRARSPPPPQGLYKQLAIVKDLLSEYRENPAGSAPLRGPIIVNLSQAGLQDDCPYQPAAEGREAVVLDEKAVEALSEEVRGRAQRQEAASRPGRAPTQPALGARGGHLPAATPKPAAACKRRRPHLSLPRSLPPSLAPPLPQEFGEYASRLYTYLTTIENRLFSEGLHVLGAPPGPSQLSAYLTAYFGDRLPPAAVDALAAGGAAPEAALTAARGALERAFAAPAAGVGGGAGAREDAEAALAEAGEITALLMRNVEEVDGVLAGLEGRYVPPEAGGDLLRDGPGVLPTGEARAQPGVAWALAPARPAGTQPLLCAVRSCPRGSRLCPSRPGRTTYGHPMMPSPPAPAPRAPLLPHNPRPQHPCPGSLPNAGHRRGGARRRSGAGGPAAAPGRQRRRVPRDRGHQPLVGGPGHGGLGQGRVCDVCARQPS
jgi:hypothetical protein